MKERPMEARREKTNLVVQIHGLNVGTKKKESGAEGAYWAHNL